MNLMCASEVGMNLMWRTDRSKVGMNKSEPNEINSLCVLVFVSAACLFVIVSLSPC
jgi:hypothetical protein